MAEMDLGAVVLRCMPYVNTCVNLPNILPAIGFYLEHTNIATVCEILLTLLENLKVWLKI